MSNWIKVLLAALPVIGSLGLAASEYMDGRAKAAEAEDAQAREMRCVEEWVRFLGENACEPR